MTGVNNERKFMFYKNFAFSYLLRARTSNWDIYGSLRDKLQIQNYQEICIANESINFIITATPLTGKILYDITRNSI